MLQGFAKESRTAAINGAKQNEKQMQVSNEKREEEADEGKKTKATEQQCTDRSKAAKEPRKNKNSKRRK